MYISARREVLEEELDPSLTSNEINMQKWPAIYQTAIPQSGTNQVPLLKPYSCTFSTAVAAITDALLSAKFPLILAGNSGRNTATIPLLTSLSSKLAIALFMACPSVVSVPFDHPHFLGVSFGGPNPLLAEADVILILDVDVPWIDTAGNAPRSDAKVFVLDPDPLKQTYGWSHVDADLVCRADAEVALQQLLDAVGTASSRIDISTITMRAQQLAARHSELIAKLESAEANLTDAAVAEPAFVIATLREVVAAKTPSRGSKTLWLNEGISAYPAVFDHVRPSVPGSMIASGGSSLGWALGAAVGAGVGVRGKHELMVAVVGDGTFLFGVPSAAYWMARRYDTVCSSHMM